MQQTARGGAGFAASAGEFLSGAVLTALIAVVAALAWISWPADPVGPDIVPPAASTEPVATAAVSPLSRPVMVEFVVESEEQERLLRERGVIPSSPNPGLPISVEVVSLPQPAEREARDEHLRTVCAVTECTKVLYVDLRTVSSH